MKLWLTVFTLVLVCQGVVGPSDNILENMRIMIKRIKWLIWNIMKDFGPKFQRRNLDKMRLVGETPPKPFNCLNDEEKMKIVAQATEFLEAIEKIGKFGKCKKR